MADYIPELENIPRLPYERIGWEDAPSRNTPISADNLNHMDNGIAAIYEDIGVIIEDIVGEGGFEDQIEDFETQVNNKIDEFETFVESGMPEYVSDWLTEHVDPVGSAVVVDDTLSISGAAADAKVTGDEITDLKADISYGNLNQHILYPLAVGNNNTLGSLVGLRGDATSQVDNSVKIVRNSTSPTYKTYGVYSRIETDNSLDLTGHKIYIGIFGIDVSGDSTNLNHIRIFGSYNGTSQGIPNTDFTLDSTAKVEHIFAPNANINQIMIVLEGKNASSLGAYWSIGYIQYVDLTKMFGVGNEPSLSEFKAVYSSDMPYPQLMPQITTDTKAIEYAINKYKDEIPYEVIDTMDQMSTVTKDRVLVMHNNSDYGDGGACWFEYLSYATEYGYARADGGKMYPMLDQAPLLASDPPIKRMMSLISSYVENNDLVYGRTGTLFNGTTTNELDCSSFISAVLNGISYYSSKYVGSYNFRVAQLSSYAPVKSSTYGHVVTRLMAQYFAEQKWLHKMPTETTLKNVLQFGDILFSYDGTTEAENRYLKIGHVSIVLSVTDSNRVIVAQCGSYPSAVVDHDNSNTAGKISSLILSSSNISTYFSAFARIPYINKDVYTQTGNKIRPVFIPSTYVNASSKGIIANSSLGATSIGYTEVLPGSQVTFTGAKTYNSKSLTAEVAEYDEHLQFLARTGFTNVPITLNASTRFVKFSYAHSSGDGAMLLDDCDQFEAMITLPS